MASTSHDASAGADSAIGQDSMVTKPTQTSSFFTKLPAETRLQIYKLIFHVPTTITLGVGPDGYFAKDPNCSSSIAVDFMCTCSQARDEAQVLIYLNTKFQIPSLDTRHLAPSILRVALPLRMLMQNIVFIGSRHRCHYHLISDVFQALNEIKLIFPVEKGPAPFLLAIYELSKTITNSPIRAWPRLEVHVSIPVAPAAIQEQRACVSDVDNFRLDDAPFSIPSRVTNMSRENIVMEADRVRANLYRRGEANKPLKTDLTSWSPWERSITGMNREIPAGDIQTISLHGFLCREHLAQIKDHTCSLGDCSFKKVGREITYPTSGYREEVYLWQRSGSLSQATSIEGEDFGKTAQLMHEFAPALDPQFVTAMIEAGMMKPSLVAEQKEALESSKEARQVIMARADGGTCSRLEGIFIEYGIGPITSKALAHSFVRTLDAN